MEMWWEPRSRIAKLPSDSGQPLLVFRVDRRRVYAMLEDQTALMRSARMLPASRNGRIVGVQVFCSQGDSTFLAAGFRSGDVLRTVNGHDITTPNGALEAYSRLRAAPLVRVGIERDGRPMELLYILA